MVAPSLPSAIPEPPNPLLDAVGPGGLRRVHCHFVDRVIGRRLGYRDDPPFLFEGPPIV